MKLIRSLNEQLFRQKRRYANLVLEVQALMIVFLLVLSLCSFAASKHTYDSIFMIPLLISGSRTTWSGILSSLAICTTIGCDLIFAGLMAWQNERINNSQTFQLLPLSTAQIWLTNLFSSLLACAYLFLIQVLVSWLLSLPTMLLDLKINPWHKLFVFLSFHSSWGNWLEGLGYITALTLLIFILVTFVNYASKIIGDLLPLKNGRWLRFVLMAIITVVGLYFALQINDHLMNAFIHDTYIPHKNGGEEIIENPFWLENIEVWAGAIIFGGIDLWLGQKFWEPKRDQ